MSPGLGAVCVLTVASGLVTRGEAAAEEWLTDCNLPSPRLDQTAASPRRMPLSTNGMQQLCGGAAGWAG